MKVESAFTDLAFRSTALIRQAFFARLLVNFWIVAMIEQVVVGAQGLKSYSIKSLSFRLRIAPSIALWLSIAQGRAFQGTRAVRSRPALPLLCHNQGGGGGDSQRWKCPPINWWLLVAVPMVVVVVVVVVVIGEDGGESRGGYPMISLSPICYIRAQSAFTASVIAV